MKPKGIRANKGIFLTEKDIKRKEKLKGNIQAFIFDMDGVLVDSMPYHFISWHEALRPFGVRVSCFDVYLKEGEKWQKSLTYFLRQEHIKPTKKILNQIFAIHEKVFKKTFKRFIFRGAPELLRELKEKGYKLGLVTGTNSSRVRKILTAGLLELFDSIVTGDDVKKGKPHPEPYLNAAKMLGVAPGKCVVIENAPYGIESAKRADMFCVAITTSLPIEYLKRADKIIDKLEQLSSII